MWILSKDRGRFRQIVWTFCGSITQEKRGFLRAGDPAGHNGLGRYNSVRQRPEILKTPPRMPLFTYTSRALRLRRRRGARRGFRVNT